MPDMVGLSGQALTTISTIAAAAAAGASVFAIAQTTKGRHDERVDRDRRELGTVVHLARWVGEEADKHKMDGQPYYTVVNVQRQLSAALRPFPGQLPACQALADSQDARDALTKVEAALTEVEAALDRL